MSFCHYETLVLVWYAICNKESTFSRLRAVVDHAIGDDDVRCPVNVVVAANLVKNALGERNMGGFAFHN